MTFNGILGYVVGFVQLFFISNLRIGFVFISFMQLKHNFDSF